MAPSEGHESGGGKGCKVDSLSQVRLTRPQAGQIDEKVKNSKNGNNTIPLQAPAQDLASCIARMPNLLSARDLYQLLHISRTSLYERVQAGTIPYVRMGTIIRFDPAHIAAWLRGCEVGNDDLKQAA